MRQFQNVDDFIANFGTTKVSGDWMTIDQGMIDGFADVTGDHQWIHTDPEAAKQGPYGVTIAHGYLTVSLIPRLLQSVYEIKNKKLGINYGLDKLRFPSPVTVDSRVRANLTLAESHRLSSGAHKIFFDLEIEVEGQAKLACVARLIFVYS